jgi:hypothetical protein
MITDSIPTISVLRDTIEVIDASQVSLFYADMIGKQQGQFNLLLVAIGVIVATVLTATWWWNYKASKAQITEEIQTGLKKYQRLFTAHKASTEELIDAEVDKRIKKQVEALSSQMITDLETFKKSITNDSKKMRANLCRIFALHCSSDNGFFNSASWWLSAFEDYLAINNGEFEQISIDAYVEALEECLAKEIISDDQKESIAGIIERTSKIPDVYTDQRNKAKKLLKKIEEKAKKAEEK